MISQKAKKRFNKVIIMTAACSMFSMFGTSILHTKAATHSAAPAVYVSPQNIPASDIISIDCVTSSDTTLYVLGCTQLECRW